MADKDHNMHGLHAAEAKLKQLRTAVKPKAEIVKKSLTTASFLTLAVKTIALVLFYYTFSIGLTFYNQRFIKHFNYPLSLTMAHLTIKFMLAAGIRAVVECVTGRERINLGWTMFCYRIALVGIASSLDIGLSNWSFEFITVSLYTMSKSSAILFILFCALIFRLEKWRWSLVIVVALISSGLFMFVYHSTQFNGEGFAMVMAASVLSGLRWTLAQVALQKSELGLTNPLDMMYYIQPWMMLGLLPLSVAIEGVPLATTEDFFRYHDDGILLRNIGLVLLGVVLAFCLEFSEFLLLSQTSSLTLAISGIFKECITLLLAHIFNHDSMNVINGIGLVVCLSGIVVHVVLKAIRSREENLKTSDDFVESIGMLTTDGSANISDDDAEEIFNVRHR